MKKRITKKLELSKETLRHLERTILNEAAGGVTAAACTTYTNCCSGYATCATCATQCGTRLC